MAEGIGFIVPLGEWVLWEACREAASWPDDLEVAVNLSPVQFGTPGLVQVVTGALAASGLDPARLELEITETIARVEELLADEFMRVRINALCLKNWRPSHH